MRGGPLDGRGSRQGRWPGQPGALAARQAEVPAGVLHRHEGPAFFGKAGCHRPGRAQRFAVHCHHVFDAGGGTQATQKNDGIGIGRDVVNQPSRGAACAELLDQGCPHASAVVGHHQIASGHQPRRGQPQGRSSHCTQRESPDRRVSDGLRARRRRGLIQRLLDGRLGLDDDGLAQACSGRTVRLLTQIGDHLAQTAHTSHARRAHLGQARRLLRHG